MRKQVTKPSLVHKIDAEERLFLMGFCVLDEDDRQTLKDELFHPGCDGFCDACINREAHKAGFKMIYHKPDFAPTPTVGSVRGCETEEDVKPVFVERSDWWFRAALLGLLGFCVAYSASAAYGAWVFFKGGM